MTILRMLVVVTVLTPMTVAGTRLTIAAGEVDRRASPIVATVKSGDLSAGTYDLKPTDGGETVVAQVERTSDGAIVRWVEPNLEKGKSRTYELAIHSGDVSPTFRFTAGEGSRDLLLGETPVWRDMVKYDPADRDATYKVYTHVFATSGDGFITKGPGGKYPHHRGIFFGFKAFDGQTPLGDYWHCPDVTQRHVKYLTDREFTGPVAARVASVTDWVGKDEKPVARDTREWTTWRIGPKAFVYDYEITVESLIGKPIKLGGDAHHAGFHFRAAQEVADAKGADGKAGGAVYTRPTSAKHTGNDIWTDCPWVHCSFDVQRHHYEVTHLDVPGNPTPTTYSTRPYGRFGAFFTTEVPADKPLKLSYRLVIGQNGAPTDEERTKLLAELVGDVTSPAAVQIDSGP
jgi:hypothetical protein